MSSPADMEDIAERAAAKTIDKLFTRLGVDIDEPLEMQKDFAHLRKWRHSVEMVQSTSLKVVVTTFITGILALLYMIFGHPK
jgi:hypothetical protein